MHSRQFLLICILFLTTYAATHTLSSIGKPCTPERTHADCGDEYVCRNNTCSYCIEDSECPNLHMCRKESETETKCVHKNLFPSFSVFDALSTVICFIGASLAATTGVGGGGIYVPTLIAIGQFSTTLGIALSKVVIFGSAISNWILFGRQKHPDPTVDRPVINYDIVMLIEPIVLCGVTIGVFMNISFPYWLTTILLVLLLSYSTYRTFKKGRQTYLKENESRRNDKQQLEDVNVEFELPDQLPDQLVFAENFEYDPEKNENSQDTEDHNTTTEAQNLEEKPSEQEEGDQKKLEEGDTHSQEGENQEHSTESIKKELLTSDEKLKKILKRESRKLPWEAVLALCIAWGTQFIVSLLKGSHGMPSILGIKQCSWGYWLTVVSMFPPLLILSLIIGFYLRRQHKKKIALGYKFVKGDIPWNTKNTILIPFACLTAGIAAGLLGIGGGMVIGPVLLEMHVLPQVATSSSALMIFWTSSATVAQFSIFGVLPWDYGLWFGVVGLLGSVCGQYIIDHFVKKFKRASLIVFVLTATMAISTAAMLALAVYRIIMDLQMGAYMGFRSPC